MPLTAKRTSGFEFKYNIAGHAANSVRMLLVPNVAFVKGMLVGIIPAGTANAGKITPWVAASRYDQRQVAGVMAESIAQADNPAAGETYGEVYTNPFNVYKVTAVPGINGDVAPVVDATHTTTTSMVTATAFTNNDRANGSLIYFYEGPGSPAIRLVSTAVGANNKLIWIKALSAIPTADTKFVLFGATNLDTADGGIFPGIVGLTVDDDSRRVTASGAAVPAQQPVKVIAIDPATLTMDVMFQGMLKG